MKNSHITPFLIGVFLMIMISCEKAEIESSEEEGYMSTFKDEPQNQGLPEVEGKQVLAIHFDDSYSESEKEAIWANKVKEFKANQTKRAGVIKFYIRAVITTGTKKNAATDGGVKLRTNVSGYYYRGVNTAWISFLVDARLDNPGDDREGGDDFYLIEYDDPYNQQRKYKNLSIRRYYLGLRGTDGWYVTNTQIGIMTLDHPGSSGGTLVYETANYWLDNSSSSGWDYYTSKMWSSSQSGTIIF